MTDSQTLAIVFDKGSSDGMDSLSSDERELYLIQDFILQWEMDAFSGYFYNHLPHVDLIVEAVVSMRKHGLHALADILNEALELFRDYTEPTTATTWRKVLKQYDPNDCLSHLDHRIHELHNYGLPN